jgi:DNA-binding Xre family transcriptional regulator
VSLESNIAGFIKKRGINLSAMARDTGIPYMSLYDSLLNDKRERQLRGSELLAICEFLSVSPTDFVEEKEPVKK